MPLPICIQRPVGDEPPVVEDPGVPGATVPGVGVVPPRGAVVDPVEPLVPRPVLGDTPTEPVPVVEPVVPSPLPIAPVELPLEPRPAFGGTPTAPGPV